MLAQLDGAFVRHARADGLIDAEGLRRALRLRNDFLAQRMLSILDRNGDGRIDREDFIRAVRGLVFGSAREQMRFSFQIHDIDGDGRVHRHEIRRMIAMNLGEEAGSDDAGDEALRQREGKVDELTDLLFNAADQDLDGSVSFAEFKRVSVGQPNLLELVTKSAASWVLPESNLLGGAKAPAKFFARIRRVIENRATLVVFLALLGVINIALFVNGALAYQGQGPWVMLPRGCGASLNFNGALILVPVMRRILTWLRSRRIGRLFPIDDALLIRRLLAYAILLLGLVHSAAHFVNYSQHDGILTSLMYTSAGRTGATLLLISMVMWAFSLPRVRKSGRFELFYFSHLAYVLWFAVALLHGPRFWQYALVPLLAFALEYLLKSRRRIRDISGADVSGLSSGVTHLTVPCPPDFQNRPGDYAFVRIPALARHEWRPFTINSAPGAELGFHIGSEGDWTKSLHRMAKASDTPSSMVVNIDGPFGTPSANILGVRYALMIGAGIGVTPFASVLESLVNSANAGQGELKKAHFYWLNRDSRSFEWFADLLLKVEQMDARELVDIHICMTGGRSGISALALNLARKLAHDLGKPDLTTGLRSQTRLGAPDFDHELAAIAARHAPDVVDVFFCGPPGLGRRIKDACRRHALRFHQEVF